MSYADAYDPLDGIAIVGMAGRFPEADTVAELWRNVLAGRESICRFSADELEPAHPEDMEARLHPAYVRARGVLADVDMFDERFFGFNPREAAVLDPQHRLFLMAAWEALEHAGHDPRTFAGPIGVFAGATNNSYYLQNLHSRRDVTDPMGALLTSMGNTNDYVATRVAYKFNLTGPALNIQNACSTSLVAVCTAVQSLQTYQCDMALAGGVSIQLPQKRGYLHEEGSILSPDGHCRPFDTSAAGTVFSNGLGVVVLRRLRDALEDGDTVYAVIKGAALNNDGSTKVSFTAPSVDGHTQVISMAQALAGIDPDTISYVEAHGTGTLLGDPIEIAGLTRAFRAGGATGEAFCAIGSLKANIGHLDVAAGVAGLIKTALALHHKTIPASINYQAPNPRLEIESSPFFVNASSRDWPRGATPRRAAVSSFGVGGTNAHVVLEEAPPRDHTSGDSSEQLLVLSARDEDALARAAARLRVHLEETPRAELSDIAHTLQRGRRPFNHRLSLVCGSAEDAVAMLARQDARQVHRGNAESPIHGVAFMFPGQGAQHVNMGRSLYDSEPVFRDEIDACALVLQPHLGVDLRGILYPSPGREADAAVQLNHTSVAQPAIFAVEYALARLWTSRGVTPELLIGHSVGEYVAACLGGTFTRDEALVLLAQRARLMHAMPSGAMLAVRASAEQVRLHVSDGLSVAAINAPNLTVVAGDHDRIATLGAALKAAGVASRLLQTSHAFHSPMMDAVIEPFEALVAGTTRQAPRQPWISSLTGRRISDQEATDPRYWARQLREPVQFIEGLRALMTGDLALLEVGPGQALATFARQHPDRSGDQLVVTSLSPSQDGDGDSAQMLVAAGQLWTRGATIDWPALHHNVRRRRVALPTYPFERRRHWVDPSPSAAPMGVPTMAPPPAPAMLTTTQVVAFTTDDRATGLVLQLQDLFADLSGINAASLDPSTGFLELGLDSLFLTQASNVLQKRFGVKVSIRSLLEECSTLETLAARLDTALPPTTGTPASTTKTAVTVAAAQTAPAPTTGFGPYRPPVRGKSGGVTPEQQEQLAGFIERYNAKTAGSKKAAAASRTHLSDPRSVAGFRHYWKEMVYPIVSVGSRGSHLRDIDGNDYVDVTNGFGMILFGHNPDFVREAVKAQLETGIEIGPQTPLAGEVAAMVCEMVGMERAAFCSTGSEAVTAAIRVARTISGRDTIVIFAGAYHGIFDEVLARPTRSGDTLRSTPIAPGIPESMTDNVLVLEYGTPEALGIIKSLDGQLAAVLVEPVQSRRPELQPREFLHELRRITADSDTALIFDEVVTGFRVHPGGAQAALGVKADIATYGKVVGGGLPIGVVAGSAKYLDALDGGAWQFGDDSAPEVGVTFFAGTFVRHPLALAAARAVLSRLREAGPELQRGLNLRTMALVERLRQRASALAAPVQINTFSSWFCITFPQDLPLAPVFFASMREQGVHIWDGRPCFLTLAHSDADLEHVLEAFGSALAEMQTMGFLPGIPAGAGMGRDASAPVGTTLPLTSQQREMWAVTQMGDAASCAYNECFVIGLRGPLGVPSLRAALALAAQRHEALRARITPDGDAQDILPSFDVSLPEIDLSHDEPGRRDARIAALIERELTTPFEMSVAPLWRAQVVHEGPDQHRLLFTVHHIVADGWSSAVLFGDIARAYAADRLGLAPQLPPPASYRAFVTNGTAPAAVAEAAESEDYWAAQYAKGVPTLDLPADRARPRVKTYAVARATRTIDSALYQAVRTTGARHGASLFVTLLATFEVLLTRLSGAHDFVLGIPMASQALEDNGHLVAHGVNTIPLACHVDTTQTFESHLRAVRAGFLDAQAHQRLTFGSLVQRLKLPRDPGRTPLVSVTFNIDKLKAAFDFGDVTVDSIDVPKGFGNFDLTVNVIDDGVALRVECDYNAGLWDNETISRWLGHYAVLLRAVTTSPDPISDLPLLSAGEEAELATWNDTRRVYPSIPVHQLIEQQVVRAPEATALVYGAQTTTYRELDRRSNRLARHMRSLGVGRGSLVGICLERSTSMVVAQLATLKTGAAYVPLDPSFPPERLEYMAEDAGIALLLTQSSLVAGAAPSTGHRLVLDAESDALEQVDDSSLPPDSSLDARGDDPAYVIYTSGSTGTPKGVVVPHRAVVNFLTSMAVEPGLDASARLVAVTTLSFDISVLELLLPLAVGACLIVADRDDALDGWALRRLLEASRATVMQGTPGTWRLLIEAGWAGAPGFKALIGGEPMPQDLAESLLQRVGELWNMYGPTETTVWSTCWRVEHPERGIFIGHPIANTRVHVLDERLHACPAGVAGEIYIGGDGLASGYWQRPELTAEKFVRDPRQSDSMLYRTGDLGRWCVPGDLEHLGRLDSQLKIRGFRIEPGEIETLLNVHPGITRARVVAREIHPGDQRLIAYVVPNGEMPIPAVLREHLAGRLPDYMVPQHFIALDAIPLLPNGKVDTRALPSPEGVADLHAAAPVAPRTPTEALVTATFAEVLHRDNVGVLDNFFDLGGHSLMAARVIAALRSATGVNLPLRNLFERPTPEGLASAIDALTWAAGSTAQPESSGPREELEL